MRDGYSIPRFFIDGCHHRAQTIFTAGELNNAVTTDTIAIFRKTELNPELWVEGSILKDRKTGEFVDVPSRHFWTRQGPRDYPEIEWEWMAPSRTYRREVSLHRSWGAYVVPNNLNIGDRIFLPELIEDVYAHEFWGDPFPADDGVGVWNGSDLELDLSVYKGAEGSLIG